MPNLIDQLLAAVGAGQARDLAPSADNEPTDAELLGASVEQAEARDLDRYVSPRFEATRPSIDEALDVARIHAAKVRELGVPVPATSNTWATAGPSATCGRPVQIVPASGGRARRVTIRNGAAIVQLFTDAREGVDATTPATGGYALPVAGIHETTTQGPIYAAGAAAWSVSVWVDHYGEPVAADGS